MTSLPSPVLFLDQFGTLGGGQRVLLEILQPLDSSKYLPTIALNGEGYFRDLLVKSGYQVADLGIGNYRSGKKSKADSVRFLWRTALCSFQVIRLVNLHRVKLLYANGPRTFVCASVAGKITGQPVIWHLHNVLAPGVELRLLSLFSGWVHQIITCSQAAAQPLLDRRPKLHSKITVVPNPVPRWESSTIQTDAGLRTGNPATDGDNVGVGILGRVTPFKGQLQFVEAARLVLREFHKVHFWIIGSPEPGNADDAKYFSQIRHLVEDSQLEDHFSFVAHQQDIQPCYERLAIVTVASQGPEAFPLTVLEAMSLGKGIVAPCQGGIPELLEDGQTALLVPQARPEALAQAMLQLLRDVEKRQCLGRNARRAARERFSSGLFIERILRILGSALSSA